MVFIHLSSTVFVQPKVGEALEIIGSSKKLGLFLHLLNHIRFLGSEMLFPFAAYFFPAGGEFTVSGHAFLGSVEQVFKVQVL